MYIFVFILIIKKQNISELDYKLIYDHKWLLLKDGFKNRTRTYIDSQISTHRKLWYIKLISVTPRMDFI